jgi:hypothetical protein
MATAQPKVYVADQQQLMLHAWEENGYCGLAQAVLEMETYYSVNINHSRIVGQTQYMPHAVVILSQLEDDMINSLLQNRLIEDILNNTITVDPQRFTIHHSRQHTNDVACGIYANYLLDPQGHGLTVNEYEEFVEGMLACIENRLMQTHRQGFDIDQAATLWFHSFTGRTVSDIPDMRKSCAKPANLQTFKHSQAALITEAKAQSATEIRPAGEAGFSIDVHDRCCDHEELKGSANFFRLARCVLNALWPQKAFKLHSVYLFQAFNVEHVEYGEGVATHLVGGYPAYGGFNYTQAGMQIQSAKIFGHTKWRKMATENPDTQITMKDNMRNEIQELTEKIEKLEVSLEPFSLTKAYH